MKGSAYTGVTAHAGNEETPGIGAADAVESKSTWSYTNFKGRRIMKKILVVILATGLALGFCAVGRGIDLKAKLKGQLNLGGTELIKKGEQGEPSKKKEPFVCGGSDTRYNNLANNYGTLKRVLAKCEADPGYAKQFGWKTLEECMPQLEEALKVAEALKCPDTCVVDDQPHDLMAKKYTFSDVKKDMPALRAIFAAGKDAFVAKAGKAVKDADNAKYGEFRKLLKDDKLAMWEAEKNSRIYGVGKKVLTSAAALKTASVWFTHSYNTTYPGSWRVTGVRFKGDKKINEWVKEGTGISEAPVSAFK